MMLRMKMFWITKLFSLPLWQAIFYSNASIRLRYMCWIYLSSTGCLLKAATFASSLQLPLNVVIYDVIQVATADSQRIELKVVIGQNE